MTTHYVMPWKCETCTLDGIENELVACPVCETIDLSRLDGSEASFAACGGFVCGGCDQRFERIEDLYTLDACSHRFCYPCIDAHVARGLCSELGANIGCLTCDIKLSVRDLQDLSRRYHPPQRTTTKHNAAAARRLMKELKSLEGNRLFEIHLVEDTLTEWQVLMVGFNPQDADPNERDLARDLKHRPIDMRVLFPPDYPQSPPFIRVISPRFKFHTGHVTIGGSICTESLTSTGWDPSMTMESILVGIRADLIAGGGRIDKTNPTPYGDREAREAFRRMCERYGWKP